jgi:UDP-GlcNAc:undecaprenyl-phosphate GlcNAc-1-phosphate transferase
MNAFNMIDGLNGLCAAIAINALLLVYVDNQYSTGPIIMIGSILGFLFYNLGFFGQKRTIFLGDNGSNFLGLTVAITCVYYADDICSDHIEGSTSGVTMLWLVAIPLWDCIRVILDRLSTKRLPFSPGRDHFHHILLDQGLPANQILRAYIFVSFLIGIFGIVLEKMYHDTPYVSFYCFVFFSFIYLILCSKIKKQK